MPSISYRDGLLERLKDPEYASLLLETVLSEAIEDGYVEAIGPALGDVLEAAKQTQTELSDTNILRARLYDLLDEREDWTIDEILAAMKNLGLNLKVQSLEAQPA